MTDKLKTADHSRAACPREGSGTVSHRYALAHFALNINRKRKVIES